MSRQRKKSYIYHVNLNKNIILFTLISQQKLLKFYSQFVAQSTQNSVSQDRLRNFRLLQPPPPFPRSTKTVHTELLLSRSHCCRSQSYFTLSTWWPFINIPYLIRLNPVPKPLIFSAVGLPHFLLRLLS